MILRKCGHNHNVPACFSMMSLIWFVVCTSCVCPLLYLPLSLVFVRIFDFLSWGLFWGLSEFKSYNQVCVYIYIYHKIESIFIHHNPSHSISGYTNPYNTKSIQPNLMCKKTSKSAQMSLHQRIIIRIVCTTFESMQDVDKRLSCHDTILWSRIHERLKWDFVNRTKRTTTY